MIKRNKSFFAGEPFYFIATPIGNLSEVSSRFIEIVKAVDFIACEDTRVTGKLLAALGLSKPLISVHEFNEASKSNEIISRLTNKEKGAYMSDAGYPLVSDPGSLLLKSLLDHDFKVSVVNGANALLPALLGSGISSTHFYFHGFLDAKNQKETLENLTSKPETLIFYEAPHRIEKTLHTLFDAFGPRQACLVRELTKIHEEYIYGTLNELVELDFATIKGELVLIVEGQTSINKTAEIDYTTNVNELVKNGLSIKDAVKAISVIYKISKNELYDRYLKQYK